MRRMRFENVFQYAWEVIAMPTRLLPLDTQPLKVHPEEYNIRYDAATGHVDMGDLEEIKMRKGIVE